MPRRVPGIGAVASLCCACAAVGPPPRTATAKGDAAPDPAPPTGALLAADAAARACPPARTAGDFDVTLASLLAAMVDLESLAELPEPAFASALSSSHDRASDTAAPGSGRWFANHDFVGLAEGATTVLLDVDGPGAVTRIWSASPGGTVRIYLDGAASPTVEAPFADLLAGRVEPFTAPFAFVAAHGHDLYFPIPFAKRCRITLTGPVERTYYHVTHRAYAPGARVEPFGAAALADSACMRAVVAERLRAPPASSAGAWRSFELDSDASTRAAVVEAPAGGGVVRRLRVTPGVRTPEALRATVLSIAFDDQETVRVPLGDFFASGRALGDLESVPVQVDAASGAMTARWPMPFARQARVALEPTGDATLKATLELLVDAAPFGARSLYFHARWHAPETFPSKPARDWNLITLEGSGLYVGNVLNVVNRNEAWWGEGDEKIYVDGEAFPSHFGTGTEDYYGYAYCSNLRFTKPYVGQPLAGEPRNFGDVSLYRFHVLDPIPFRESLRFDLEVRHWGEPVDVTYDAVSFWYARPGSRRVGSEPAAEAYRLPALDAPTPTHAPGPYRCGG